MYNKLKNKRFENIMSNYVKYLTLRLVDSG